jgi:hypothetical protein
MFIGVYTKKHTLWHTSNSYSGPTRVLGGELRVTHTGALGGGGAGGDDNPGGPASNLAGATLVGGSGNRLIVSGTNALAGFTPDGGYVAFDAAEVSTHDVSSDFLEVGVGGTVAVRIPTENADEKDKLMNPADTPLLQQDQGDTTQLARSAATTIATNADANTDAIVLYDLAGKTAISVTDTAAILQGDNGATKVATGTYYPITCDSSYIRL